MCVFCLKESLKSVFNVNVLWFVGHFHVILQKKMLHDHLTQKYNYTFQLILLPCLSGAGDNVCSEPQNAVSSAFKMLRLISNIKSKQHGKAYKYDLN